MSLPPEDVSDEDLFRKLLERPAPSEVIDWPGKTRDTKIRIEVLRKDEIDNCRERAQRWWNEGHGKTQEQQGLLVKEIVADRVACEILAKCVTRTKPIEGTEERGATAYARVFPNADGVRKALFPDELEVLWQAYNLTQYRYGPYEDTVTTAEERNAWVAKLARGGNAYPLLSLAYPQLLKLTACLATERLICCAVMDTLLPELPPHWAVALKNLGLGFGSSIYPPVECTEQGGLQIRWPEEEKAPVEPATPKNYIDVREIAEDIVREQRLATLEPDQED